MPVRAPKKNYSSSVSGIKFSGKNQRSVHFESTLERDFIYLLEFDINVRDFEEQPVTIEYYDPGQKLRRYTPDFLVRYRMYDAPAKFFNPVLCEIKYHDDLRKNWKDYKPKFQAAMLFAKREGWRFKILTEKQIRTNYLVNAKFLLRYRHAAHDLGMIENLFDTLKELRVSYPEEIIKVASVNTSRRAELLHNLWFMISNNMLGCDYTNLLTMKSEIWLLEDQSA